jgi:hypothetical protein
VEVKLFLIGVGLLPIINLHESLVGVRAIIDPLPLLIELIETLHLVVQRIICKVTNAHIKIPVSFISLFDIWMLQILEHLNVGNLDMLSDILILHVVDGLIEES